MVMIVDVTIRQVKMVNNELKLLVERMENVVVALEGNLKATNNKPADEI